MNRRNFIKGSLMGSGMLLSAYTGANNFIELEEVINSSIEKGKNRVQRFNMCGYAAPKIPVVRIGFIGLGGRGSWAVKRILNIQGVEIVALADIKESAAKKSQESLTSKNLREAKEYYGNEYSWKALCEQEDIDLVYIATPWECHVPMAVYAMECGKHVAVEVPAARTLEECWQLVETSEKTKKHCMQLENCCYDFFEIATVNMAQKGLLGEIMHGEGAYIHDLLVGLFGTQDNPGWRWRENRQSGNPYPTHGLGPVCWAMNINRGDKFEYLTSMSSDDFMLGALAKEKVKTDSYYKAMAEAKFRGNMNTSIVKTNKGKTIMIQHDVSSPRPYSRLHTLSGTKGFVQKYPEPGKIAFGHEFMNTEEANKLENEYSPELITHIREMAKKVGGHGGMDFVMDWRLIDCLRNGLPLDMDVYDAALWSSITSLSIWSVANRSNSIDVPDFTGGSWRKNAPVDLTLRGGGNTLFAD